MRRFLTLALTGFVVVMIAGIGGSAAAPLAPPSTQDIAKRILDKAALTNSARMALEMIARGDRRVASDPTGADPSKSSKGKGGHAPGGAGMINVRVSNPGEDTTQLEQTTQSETSIAVSGLNVAVGFNDSQTTLPFLTAGSDLSGFAFSRNGGQTFVDGGALPNAPADINFGDPWLASDSAGNMYYSTLTLDFSHFSLFTGLSKSTDGGKTWTGAAPIPPPPSAPTFGYFADKDALSAGPGVGNLYDGWDDFTFSFDPNTGAFVGLSGLPVAHSTNGGQTWTDVYAAQTVLFSFTPGQANCSFHQFIGAQPFVGPDGTVYDAALKFGVDDPTCSGAPFTENEWIFASHDGGTTWSPGVKIADVLAASGFFFGAFQLGPGQLMRELELPSVAAAPGSTSAGTLYVTWNDGSVLAAAGSSAIAGGGGGVPPPSPPPGSGHSHIALSKSTDGGNTWSTPIGVTSGDNDEAQPAVSVDGSGIHDLYYEITPSPASDGTRVLDVLVSDSTDGGQTWSATRVTTQSFPGVFTFPQFDPVIAFAYMGDYIANVSDGTHQFFSWGDNRDMVTDFLWPNGRHDPDVFAAVR